MQLSTSQEAGPASLRVLLVLTSLAVLFRLYGINQWHLVGDEYFTVYDAVARSQAIINPAYYALVAMLAEIFGPTPWIARVPAVIFGVLSIPCLYLVWRRFAGNNVALFAALITLLSAWHLWHSQFARFYSAVFFISIFSYALFYRAAINNSLKDLALALVTSVIGILFHATFVMVPVSAAAAYFVFIVLRRYLQNDLNLRIPFIFLSLCVIASIPALYFFLLKILSKWLSQEQVWGYGPLLIAPQMAKYVQFPIAIASLFGAYVLFLRDRVLATFLVVSIAIPILFLMLASSGMSVRPDFAFYTLPLIILLAGVACESIYKRFSCTQPQAYSMITLILLCLVPEFFSHFTAKSSLNFKDAVSFVEKNYRSGDQILSFIQGFRQDTDNRYELLPFIAIERDGNTNWNEELQPLLESGERTWMLLRAQRKPYAPQLEKWLFCNATLVWQRYATRMDYEVDGHQIFLVQPRNETGAERNHCHNLR